LWQLTPKYCIRSKLDEKLATPVQTVSGWSAVECAGVQNLRTDAEAECHAGLASYEESLNATQSVGHLRVTPP
jgi:hypothetical protein